MMNKRLYACWLILLFCLSAQCTQALETDFLPDVKEGAVSIKITNPEREVGYTVGDVLTRDITVTVKKPYKLVVESLPIIGYERRYKGQLIGVDLSALTHSKQDNANTEVHKISLSYQVFTNNVVAKPAALPAEFLRIIDTSKTKDNIFKYRIPSWNFSISPLSVFGQVKVESDMSGYRGPLLLDASQEKARLKVLLPILGLSLLGLLYMLGKHAWLPRMGGPFATAYKRIQKSKATEIEVKEAFTSMHNAFNQTAGYSLFSNNTQTFLNNKSSFSHLQSEINQFFTLSRQVFFAKQVEQKTYEQALGWLAAFSKQCRDCERGLIPDSLSTSNLKKQ